MKPSVIQVASVAFLLLAVALAGLLYRKTLQCQREATRINTLYVQAREWEAKASRGQIQLDSLKSRFESTNDQVVIRGLQRQGLTVADLIADLQKHPEIIPHPGIGGGRMGFYFPEQIRVLSGRWVYAYFEDGHIGGEALLEYNVMTPSKISWKVVASRLQ